MARFVISWAMVGLLLAASFELAYEQLWILAFVPLVAWAIAGLVLLMLLLWRLRRPELRGGTLGLLVVVVVSLFVFPGALEMGRAAAPHVRLYWHRREFEEVVAGVVAKQAEIGSGWHDAAAVQYVVDAGPPLRIAFPWGLGIVDNWCGAVYDPSREVLRTNGFHDFSDAWREAEVTKLFGGDMTGCRELDEAWFECCFT